MFEPRIGSGKMSAEPMAAGDTLRVDALHGPAGQVLHEVPLRSRQLGGTAPRFKERDPKKRPSPSGGEDRRERCEFCSRRPLVSREIGHYM